MTTSNPREGFVQLICNLDHGEYGPLVYEVPVDEHGEPIFSQNCEWHFSATEFDRAAYEEELEMRKDRLTAKV